MSSNSTHGRLWDKGGNVNALLHSLTVGNDYLLDRELVDFDCAGSAAHARMLTEIRILSPDEARQLVAALKNLRVENRAGKFSISPEMEDAHTAIELRLTEQLGDLGKKIHAGRSRNDQVVLVMRLFMRQTALQIQEQIIELAQLFLARAREFFSIPLPGYTHFQPAMPSSVGMWLAAFAEGLIECARDGAALNELLDSCPLGAAAGFGSSLKLKRERVAELLGFKRAQRNSIDIINSRGRSESRFIHWLSQIGMVLEKFAWDTLLFSTAEFDFFGLPAELTTGSSIMPQKRNLDICELARAKAARLRGLLVELLFVSSKLPSNYHRDLQYSKEPVLRAAREAQELSAMIELALKNIIVKEDRLRAAMRPEIYATYEAERLAEGGLPFREAYKQTAQAVQTGTLNASALAPRFETILLEAQKALADAEREANELKEMCAARIRSLDECDAELFNPAV